MKHLPLVVLSGLLLGVELYSAVTVLWPAHAAPPPAAAVANDPPCGRPSCSCGCKNGEPCTRCAARKGINP